MDSSSSNGHNHSTSVPAPLELQNLVDEESLLDWFSRFGEYRRDKRITEDDHVLRNSFMFMAPDVIESLDYMAQSSERNPGYTSTVPWRNFSDNDLCSLLRRWSQKVDWGFKSESSAISYKDVDKAILGLWKIHKLRNWCSLEDLCDRDDLLLPLQRIFTLSANIKVAMLPWNNRWDSAPESTQARWADIIVRVLLDERNQRDPQHASLANVHVHDELNQSLKQKTPQQCLLSVSRDILRQKPVSEEVWLAYCIEPGHWLRVNDFSQGITVADVCRVIT